MKRRLMAASTDPKEEVPRAPAESSAAKLKDGDRGAGDDGGSEQAIP
jgi:hypothetical protein